MAGRPLFALLLALAGLLAASGAARSETALLNRLEQVRIDHDVAGIIGVRLQGGRIVAAEAAGCARFAEDGRRCARALRRDDVMRVASISKLFVAYAAQTLAAQGQLDLDRDVSGYLGFPLRNPAFPDQPITARMLLSHTSSLRDGATYWALAGDPLSSLFDDATHFAADHGPGGYFTYANINTGVLATVLERVSGARFDRLMARLLFTPMGITAGYNWFGAEQVPADRVVTLYRKRDADERWDAAGPWRPQVDAGGAQPLVRGKSGPEPLPADYVPGSNATLFGPQGGLRIAGPDIARLVSAMAGRGMAWSARGRVRLLPPAAAQGLAAPVWQADASASNGDTAKGFFTAYGSGAHRFRAPGGTTLYAGHFADAFGLRGGTGIDPVTGDGFVYLITGFARDPERDEDPAAAGFSRAEVAAVAAILQR